MAADLPPDFAPTDFAVEDFPATPAKPTPIAPIFPSPKKKPQQPSALQQLREPLKPPFPVSPYLHSKTPEELYAEETATIDVNGRRFSDWETVLVELPWAESEPHFKFTTADQVEVPMNWQLLQLKPGDECAIYLGRHLAVAGVIITRQVAYDANSHGVMLDGVGVQWYAGRSSIVPEGNEPVGNYDGMSFKQVADTVLAKTGIQCVPVGILDATPFARLQCEPGETIWAFLERIARPRGIVMGSDNKGNLLAIGKHTSPPTADLIESVNIKKAQVTITVENNHNFYLMYGQTAADDKQNGTDASEQKAQIGGTATRYSPLLTTAEQPVWSQAELQARVANEARWHEGTIIQATITVQGWMRPSDNQLWAPGSNIRVYSPMAMLDQVLKAQTVRYMQSRQGGTETVLELVIPELLGDTGFKLGPLPPPALPHLPFAVPPLKLE
jgi:prophage tail gpP-like protein